jgi:hypothetical protein
MRTTSSCSRTSSRAIRQPSTSAAWRAAANEFEAFKKYTAEFPETYIKALSHSAEVLQKYATPTTQPGKGMPTYNDKQLGTAVLDMTTKAESLQRTQKLLLDHALTPEAQDEIEANVKLRETELADAVAEVARLSSGANVDPRTDGAAAITQMSDAMSHLGGKAATSVGTKLKANLRTAGMKPEMKGMMTGLMKSKGLA